MNANLFNNTLEMTKTEAKAAGKIGSDEYNKLMELRASFPTFKIVIKTPSKPKSMYNGLTYEYMKKYITKHDDEEKTTMTAFLMLTEKFEIIDGEKVQREVASYLEVREWFVNKYPEIQQAKNDRHSKIQEILNKAA